MPATSDMGDLYAILGVSEDATEEEIKREYRRLVRELHPDANGGDARFTDRFNAVTQAYEILSDPRRRTEYDRQRTLHSGAAFWSDLFADTEVDDILTRLFAGADRFAPTAPTGPMLDLTARISITFKESLLGCRLTLSLPDDPCRDDDGHREVAHPDGCATCGGSGRVARTLVVRIPPGVRDGEKVRIVGEGLRSDVSQSRGDLFLSVTVEQDPTYTRIDEDLHISATVPFPALVLGGTISVDGPYGEAVSVPIPAGTKDGGTVLVPGQGVRRRRRCGNLLVTVHALVPVELTPAQADALREFADLMGYPSGRE